MPTGIDSEDLALIKAIQTIKKYHEKEDSGQKEFDRDIWTLIEALLKTATQTHVCPVCKSAIKLYIHFS